MALASTLSLDGKAPDSAPGGSSGSAGKGGWRDVGAGEQTLANDFDYVCHGKIYRFEESATEGNMYAFFLSIFYSRPFVCIYMLTTMRI